MKLISFDRMVTCHQCHLGDSEIGPKRDICAISVTISSYNSGVTNVGECKINQMNSSAIMMIYKSSWYQLCNITCFIDDSTFKSV